MLDEDLSVLLHSTIDNFQIASDIQTIDRICEYVKQLRSIRESQREDSQKTLLALSKKLNALKEEAESAKNPPSRVECQQKLLDKDKEKLVIAKSINNLEDSTQKNEVLLARLQKELNELKAGNVFSQYTDQVDDSTILKLKLFRSLGITLQENSFGEYENALIKSNTGKDVSAITLNNQESYVLSNYIWDSL